MTILDGICQRTATQQHKHGSNFDNHIAGPEFSVLPRLVGAPGSAQGSTGLNMTIAQVPFRLPKRRPAATSIRDI
jgi:hypothetical protein